MNLKFQKQMYASTEKQGSLVSMVQLRRLVQRYNFVRDWLTGSSVVEVGCGSGIGVQFFTREGFQAEGVDVSKANVDHGLKSGLESGQLFHGTFEEWIATYAERVKVDNVVALECLYYMNIERFFAMCNQIITEGGRVIVCFANPEYPSFVAGPGVLETVTKARITDLASKYNFQIHWFSGGCGISGSSTITDKLLLFIKRCMRRLGISGGGLGFKAIFRPIFQGKLKKLDADLNKYNSTLVVAKPQKFSLECTTSAEILFAVLERDKK